MLVLRELFRGSHRSEDIQGKLRLGRNVLADRLQQLEANGVIERWRQYQDRPVRHDYHLTQKGEDLCPLLLAMLRWGNRYTVDEPPLTLRHKNCRTSWTHWPSATPAAKNCTGAICGAPSPRMPGSRPRTATGTLMVAREDHGALPARRLTKTVAS
jgi:DNA-binding HxlR family transcriptional regulator